MTGAQILEIGASASGFLTQESDGFRFLAVKNSFLPLDGQMFASPEAALRAIAASLFAEPPPSRLRAERSHSPSATTEKVEK
jgi:hypothetical protein